MLHIRRSNSDDLGIIFHITLYNICYNPSLEPSRRDGSNEGSQHMFLLTDKKNYIRITPKTLLSGALGSLLTFHKTARVRVLDKRVYLMIFFFLSLIETICCDPSAEPFRDGSDEGSQHKFYAELTKNIPNYHQILLLI